MASELERAAARSWSPLRCGETTLPTPLLLSAKLLVVTMLATGHIWTLPDPFLPFVPVLDRIGAPAAFQWTLRLTFLAGSLAIVFNRSVRLASFVVGATMLIGIASSRLYWANNTFFSGVFLTLIGLYTSERSLWLLRAQVALIYFGAGLNKLLDPDWRSGQFFEHWAVVNLEHDLYIRAVLLLPPMWLSKIMCWATIVTELSLSVGFSTRRLWPYAIWLGVLFHASMTVFTGITFVLFLYVAPASYFAFARWPREGLVVLYDGDCGICARTRAWFERFDLEGAFTWTPFQSGAGERHGLSLDALGKRLHVVIDGERVAEGFGAFKWMLLYNPVTFFGMLGVLLALHGGPAWARSVVLLALIAFFFPAFDRVGQWVYDQVATNRHRIGPEPTCSVE